MTGLKVEFFELDGFTIPLPSLEIPLHAENSMVLQSCIPVGRIHSIIDPIRDVIPRTRHDYIDQPVAVSLYNMVINAVRQLNVNIVAAAPNPLGIVIEHVAAAVERMFNHYGFKIGETPPIGNLKHHAWSSYRYVHGSNVAFDNRVHMLIGMRTIYGTNVTLVQTRFPPTLIIL